MTFKRDAVSYANRIIEADKVKKLKPQYMNYIVFLYGKIGLSYETTFMGICHGLQIIMGLPCKDENYRVEDIHKQWFKEANYILNHGKAPPNVNLPKEVIVKGGGVQLPLFQED